MMVRTTLLAVATGLLATAAPAAGASFPDRPITVIVSYDLHGATDVLARMLAPYIARHLGTEETIAVTNLPRMGGEFGFAAIAAAKPDGYTIGFINTPNVVTIPVERKASYTLDQLDPLVGIVEDPGVWTVAADSPFKTIRDVVNHAAQYPSAVKVATTGLGSDDHLAVLSMANLSGSRLTPVSFSSDVSGFNAMTAGFVTLLGNNLGGSVRYGQRSPIRVLGVMSAQRSPMAPDVPTFKEQGFDIVQSSLRGIAAPAGLPAEIRTRLVAAITAAAEDPEFKAKAAQPKSFQPLRLLDSAAFAKELKTLDTAYREQWEKRGILVN